MICPVLHDDIVFRYACLTWAEDRALRGRNSSADSGPGLGEQADSCLLPIQQSWPKAINPGGLEAEPPSQFMIFSKLRDDVLSDATFQITADIYGLSLLDKSGKKIEVRWCVCIANFR